MGEELIELFLVPADGSSDVDEEEKCNLVVEHQATGHIEDAKHLQLKGELH